MDSMTSFPSPQPMLQTATKSRSPTSPSNARLSIPSPSGANVRHSSSSPALQGLSVFQSSKDNCADSKQSGDASSPECKFDLDSKAYGYDVHQFEYNLRRAPQYGSSACAKDTCYLLRHVLTKGRFETWGELLESIQFIGEKLVRARPLELVIGNIVKRLLFIIRREHRYFIKLKRKREKFANKSSGVGKFQPLKKHTKKIELSQKDIREEDETLNPSILDIFHAREELNYDDKFENKTKSVIINELNLLIEEIENTFQSIEEYSVEHIHSNEIVLTYGYSKTVLHFLKHAAKYRSFEVFICESAPSLHGQSMADDLIRHVNTHKNDKNCNIQSVTLIADSSVFAIMSRVNKVIIGTHAVFANGGLLSHSGTHALALAAQFHSVPMVVVTGLYKLSTLYAYDQDTFNEHDVPSNLIPFEKQSEFHLNGGNVSVQNPVFDYIQPEFVEIFLTNAGGHAPSYMYRLLSEYYDTTEDRL